MALRIFKFAFLLLFLLSNISSVYAGISLTFNSIYQYQRNSDIAMAVSEIGNVYIINHSNIPQTINKFDRLFNPIGSLVLPNNFSGRVSRVNLAVDEAGDCYVGGSDINGNNQGIYKFNGTTGNLLQTFGIGVVALGTSMGAVDKKGNVYAVRWTTFGDTPFYKFDSTGNLLKTFRPPSNREANGQVNLDGAGNVYITLNFPGEIDKLDSNFNFIARITSPLLDIPDLFTLDLEDNIYIPYNPGGKPLVNVFDPSGVLLTQFYKWKVNNVADAFGSSMDVAISPDGKLLYVKDSNNDRIVILTINRTGFMSLPPASFPDASAAEYFQGLSANATGDLGSVFQVLNNLDGQVLSDAVVSISPTRNATATVASFDASTAVGSVTGVRLAGLRGGEGESSAPSSFALTGANMSSKANALLALTNSNSDMPGTFNTTHASLAADAEKNLKHTASLTNGKGGLWAHAFGYFANQDNQANTNGFRSRTGGMIIGADRRVHTNWILGAGLGYSQTLVNIKNDGGNSTIKSPFLSLYGTWFKNQFYCDLSAVFSWNTYNLSRHIVFPGLDRTATSTHQGYGITPHVGVGYQWELEQVTLEPFVQADYSYVKEDGYTETGAESLNMQVANKSSALLRSEGGLKVSKNYVLNELNTLTAIGKLSYINKKPYRTGLITANLVGQSGTFTENGSTRTQNQISPGVEFILNRKSGFSFAIRYDGEFGKGYQAHEFILKVAKKF